MIVYRQVLVDVEIDEVGFPDLKISSSTFYAGGGYRCIEQSIKLGPLFRVGHAGEKAAENGGSKRRLWGL